MEKVAIVGCGTYMNQSHGCPGEWRCLKAASQGDGKFEAPSAVVAFVKCQCPGRTVIPSLGMATKLSEIKPDKIYLSACLANSVPRCPYTNPSDLAGFIKEKTSIDVILGTHDYH